MVQEDVGLSYLFRLRRLHIDLSIYWRIAVSLCLKGILHDLFHGKHRARPEGLSLTLSLDTMLAYTWKSEDTLEEVDRLVVEYKKHLSEVVIAQSGAEPDDEQQEFVVRYMPQVAQAGLLRF